MDRWVLVTSSTTESGQVIVLHPLASSFADSLLGLADRHE